MNGIIVYKESKEIMVGEMKDIQTTFTSSPENGQIELYENLTLKEIQQLMCILEPFHEIEHVKIIRYKK